MSGVGGSVGGGGFERVWGWGDGGHGQGWGEGLGGLIQARDL